MQTEKVFRRALRALGPGNRQPKDMLGGRWVLAPAQPDYPAPLSLNAARAARRSAADRRRTNLTWLAGFIVVTFLLGLLQPLRPLLVVNLVADVLLIAYLIAVLVFAARPAPVRRPVPPVVEDLYDNRPPDVAGGQL